MNFIKTFFLILTIGISLILGSCGSDDDVNNPDPPNEEETITSLTMIFTPVSGGAALTVKFIDPDGSGINPPTQVDDIVLENSSFYTLEIVEILDERTNLIIDVKMEIQQEADEHQFFFSGSVIELGRVQHEYTDQDVNGDPIGFENEIITQTAGAGSFVLTLKHQPDGLKAPDPGDPNAGGTDIEITFDMIIQ